MTFNTKSRLYLIIISFVFICSCASRKDVVYLQNAKDFETIVDTDTFTPRFKVNDIVSIFVSVFDETGKSVKPFNLVKGSSEGSSTIQYVDYLIDVEGNIDYPVLGKIKLLGLTVEEGKKLIKEKLGDGYLEDPIVNIRIENFRITVTGEVKKPGVYAVSGERITILEALGLAGDLTIKGKRNNIMVVRDFNGNKTITRIDLTSKEVFNSPVYYLTQNDFVYVEQNKSAISSSSLDSRTSMAISIGSVLLTSAIILLTRN